MGGVGALASKTVGKQILGETVNNRFGQEDPYFERVPATRLNGKPSATRTKKRRKAVPPGISESDAKVLTKVKRRAYKLDLCLCNCCGIKFGWSSVIGIIPWIGDIIDLYMALTVINLCDEVTDLPANLKYKMRLNMVIDFVIGLVPILGDIADAVYRCNTRNAILLEGFLRAKGEKNLKTQGITVPKVDPSAPYSFDHYSDEEMDDLAVDDTGPPPAVPPKSSGAGRGNGRGWFGNAPKGDIETGKVPRQS